MSDLTVFGSSGGSPFDAIRRVDERGENWSGRELMEIMGYTVWRDFSHAIERAKAACANSGADSGQHFADARKINDQGYRSADCRLTRYGAYLVALNGDPRKPEIAAAQTYFAIKTREAEVRLVSAVPALPDMNTAEGQVAVAEMLLELARTRVEQEREIQAQRARLDWAEPPGLQGRHQPVETVCAARTSPALVRVEGPAGRAAPAQRPAPTDALHHPRREGRHR